MVLHGQTVEGMVSSDGAVGAHNELLRTGAAGAGSRTMNAIPELEDFLVRHRLAAAGAPLRWSPLSGGAHPDIWRVDTGAASLCVKRARAQPKPAGERHAPLARAAQECPAHEWAWLQFAHALVPQAVPEPLVHDEAAGLIAMRFPGPAQDVDWKRQLLAGQADARTAAAVGRTLGTLHDASAYRPDLARTFACGQNAHALWLEPWLSAAAQQHRSVSQELAELVKRTVSRRQALVHGELCPGTIHVGPHGPVFLHAGRAWYGDPAFDLAFCLSHLLLKRIARPDCAKALAQSFQALVEGYFSAASFEDRAASESRAAHLLPALMLACVDGKAPVDYVTEEADREAIRSSALAWIRQPPPRLADVARPWFRC